MQKQLEEMIDEGDFDNSDDFTVVIQPFFKNVQLPEKVSESSQCYHDNYCTQQSQSACANLH